MIDYLSRLARWVWRAWPLWAVLIVGGLHYLLVGKFPENINNINKTVGLFTQITGGLLILYSIDSNIGLIKNKKLYSLFSDYLKEFPLRKKRGIVIGMGVASAGAATMSASGTVSKKPESIEEHISLLQKQINDIKKQISSLSNDLNKKINRLSDRVQEKLQNTESKLNDVEVKMEGMTVGSVKAQILGVVLMVYSALSGYFA